MVSAVGIMGQMVNVLVDKETKAKIGYLREIGGVPKKLGDEIRVYFESDRADVPVFYSFTTKHFHADPKVHGFMSVSSKHLADDLLFLMMVNEVEKRMRNEAKLRGIEL